MNSKTYLFSTSSHTDATSINSLDITLFKPEIDFSQYDYFIITSKQASKVLKQYSGEVLKPALCISKASAEAYKNIGGEVLEVGEGYGDRLLDKIKAYPKSKKWLYLRAKVVASDFVGQVQDNGFDITEVIVYESRCSQDIQNIKIENDANLIFTSPSSVECFLKNHKIHSSMNIIVIGRTTAKLLPLNTDYKVSKETTIQACIDLIKNN